jgi:hypothetical protein
MKAPAQLSHHEANPRREMRIGQGPAQIVLDISVNGRLSTRNVLRPCCVCICAIEKSLRKRSRVSNFSTKARYHIVGFSLKV